MSICCIQRGSEVRVALGGATGVATVRQHPLKAGGTSRLGKRRVFLPFGSDDGAATLCVIHTRVWRCLDMFCISQAQSWRSRPRPTYCHLLPRVYPSPLPPIPASALTSLWVAFWCQPHFGYIYGFGMFGCVATAMVLNLLGEKPIDLWKTTRFVDPPVARLPYLAGWRCGIAFVDCQNNGFYLRRVHRHCLFAALRYIWCPCCGGIYTVQYLGLVL